MTPAEVAAKLQHFNDWRRGGDIEQPGPLAVGEVIDAAVEMIDRLEAAEKERDAAELMSLALRAKIAGLVDDMNLLRDNNTALRAKIEQMERQEPAGTLHDDGYFVWRKTAPYESNFGGWKMALYALPGAKGEEK